MPSRKNDLISLVRRHQNKDTDIYFSMSTALELVLNRDLTENIYVITFGKKINLPKEVKHKHLNTSIDNYTPYQPFKLDTLLVHSTKKTIYDPLNAITDVENNTFSTSTDNVVSSHPFLVVRAASIKAETGFEPNENLLREILDVSEQVDEIKGRAVWREIERLMRTSEPSIGIEFLRKFGLLKPILPELDSCYGVEQNTAYHKYSVYGHCLLACDECIRYDTRLRFAALIHDIGKPGTKGYNENGITFHKHEVLSTILAKKIVKRLQVPHSDAEFIVSLVENHMYQYDRKWKTSTVVKFLKKTGLSNEYLGRMREFPLFQLRQADRKGRGLIPITQKQLDFEKRIEEILIKTG